MKFGLRSTISSWNNAHYAYQNPSSTSASVTLLQLRPMSITVVGTEMFREFNALMASVCVVLTTLAQHCTGAVAHRTFGVGVGVGVGFPQPLDADGPNFDLCESATVRRERKVKILSMSVTDSIVSLGQTRIKEIEGWIGRRIEAEIRDMRRGRDVGR